MNDDELFDVRITNIPTICSRVVRGIRTTWKILDKETDVDQQCKH